MAAGSVVLEHIPDNTVAAAVSAKFVNTIK